MDLQLAADFENDLAVLVIATPCPLLIAIPVAIIGAISRAARRGIIVRNPSVLEQIPEVRTVILDKTGTLTYGRPSITEQIYAQFITRFNWEQGSAFGFLLLILSSLIIWLGLRLTGQTLTRTMG